MVYDYLIVDTGLFGSVFAYEAAKRRHSVKMLEKRAHIGGNCYTEKQVGIDIHKYGAHIFHTSSKKIWDYVNQFADFYPYIHEPIANYKGELYNLPFNMNTFYQLWGTKRPDEARIKLMAQIEKTGIKRPRNLEEQALSLVGTDIYHKLIKGYTEKQWGRGCAQLPSFIIKRLPVRYTFNNNYFTDTFQGIPKLGYTEMIQKMLSNPLIEVSLETDFFADRTRHEASTKKIVYTGMIDQYFDYCYGELAYRSLHFETGTYDTDNYQGTAVMNFTDSQTPYTRIIEHKHFCPVVTKKTVVTKEFPKTWRKGDIPYYPINDQINHALYRKYEKLAHQQKKCLFGGRLANYRYYDMDDTIAAALKLVKHEFQAE